MNFDLTKTFLDSKLNPLSNDSGLTKMNLQEIKLLDLTTEYDAVLRQLDESESGGGWTLELILLSDKRKFNATTARGNVRIFKTLETALSYALDACQKRKSLKLVYRSQEFSISPM